MNSVVSPFLLSCSCISEAFGKCLSAPETPPLEQMASVKYFLRCMCPWLSPLLPVLLCCSTFPLLSLHPLLPLMDLRESTPGGRSLSAVKVTGSSGSFAAPFPDPVTSVLPLGDG